MYLIKNQKRNFQQVTKYIPLTLFFFQESNLGTEWIFLFHLTHGKLGVRTLHVPIGTSPLLTRPFSMTEKFFVYFRIKRILCSWVSGIIGINVKGGSSCKYSEFREMTQNDGH